MVNLTALKKILSKNTTGNVRRQIIKIVFVIYITDKDLMSPTYSDHWSFEEKKTNHLVENEWKIWTELSVIKETHLTFKHKNDTVTLIVGEKKNYNT